MFGLTAELENFTVNSQYLVWRRLPRWEGKGKGQSCQTLGGERGGGSVIL